MKACAVLIGNVWTGWNLHVALLSIKWLLILGKILATVGMGLSYMENMAEIGSG